MLYPPSHTHPCATKIEHLGQRSTLWTRMLHFSPDSFRIEVFVRHLKPHQISRRRTERDCLHFLRRLRHGMQPVRDRLLLSGIRLITGIAIRGRSLWGMGSWEKEESGRRCRVADQPWHDHLQQQFLQDLQDGGDVAVAIMVLPFLTTRKTLVLEVIAYSLHMTISSTNPHESSNGVYR